MYVYLLITHFNIEKCAYVLSLRSDFMYVKFEPDQISHDQMTYPFS